MNKPLAFTSVGDECKHPDFEVQVSVNKLMDTGRFQAEININCAVCKAPFTFLGLRKGVVNLNGAVVSPDGIQARMAIFPNGKPLTKLPTNFPVRVDIRRRK